MLVLSREEMQKADQEMIELGVPGLVLMDMISSIKESANIINDECSDLTDISDKFLVGSQNINVAIEDSAKAAENQANELTQINEILGDRKSVV